MNGCFRVFFTWEALNEISTCKTTISIVEYFSFSSHVEVNIKEGRKPLGYSLVHGFFFYISILF